MDKYACPVCDSDLLFIGRSVTLCDFDVDRKTGKPSDVSNSEECVENDYYEIVCSENREHEIDAEIKDKIRWVCGGYSVEEEA